MHPTAMVHMTKVDGRYGLYTLKLKLGGFEDMKKKVCENSSPAKIFKILPPLFLFVSYGDRQD
jgi:hypothetical protein